MPLPENFLVAFETDERIQNVLLGSPSARIRTAEERLRAGSAWRRQQRRAAESLSFASALGTPPASSATFDIGTGTWVVAQPIRIDATVELEDE